ncbi:LysR family transcriptional regulator [Pusillimonas sp. CC-YST705]|uniref:LysR family transcriptional regulator n=1 Tax=Mesopusillimonas faecipullorum TaxID=2755040 RepID=A0ABS8CEF9_9BURK|nr:LysR substrate-binding domain-containing protein [Mesopusillimonas faecipullorum]MCB5364430.1 LysR family transcriptional regulator [Mesopusillimonas faecipullorum]
MVSSLKPNRVLFELDLLKALVAVAESGSFTVAATRLHSTQSTVSQKIRRLEDLAGHTLLDRSNRTVSPTEAGHIALRYARQMLTANDNLAQSLSGTMVAITVRLGLPEDFATGAITKLLSTFSRAYPHVKLEVTSGLSRDLYHSYEQGEQDLVLIKQRRHSRAAVICRPEKLAWIDSARQPCLDQDPVPLVTFPQRGLYRDDMIQALETIGRPWRISYTSSSLTGIQEAVVSGMGISLLPRRAVAKEHRILTRRSGLPDIDAYEIGIFFRPSASAPIRDLANVLVRLIDHARARS